MTGARCPLLALLLLAAACGSGEVPAPPPGAASSGPVGAEAVTVGEDPATGTAGSDQPLGARGGHRNLVVPGPGEWPRSPVDLGLDWLCRRQNEDGSWGDGDRRVRSTALALLALLGSGETHKHGKFRLHVRNGSRWLVADAQGEDGAFVPRGREGWLIDHSVATVAMCEIFCLTLSPAFKSSAQAGLDVLAATDLEGVPDPARFWVGCALRSVRNSGKTAELQALGVPEGASCLPLVLGGGRDRPVVGSFPPATPRARAAAEILVRIFAGEDPRKSGDIRRLADEVLETLPSASDDDHGAVLLGTLALFQFGGDAWKTWNEALKGALLDSQVREGEEAGSWEPTGEQGAALGRVGTTAARLLCLETYYAYTRVFTTWWR